MKILIGIGALVLVLVCWYVFSFRNSLQKIDSFCNAIDSSTKMNELKPLADKFGVVVRGPYGMSGPKGEFAYAVAASEFTMGEYACRIDGAGLAGMVTNKKLGY